MVNWNNDRQNFKLYQTVYKTKIDSLDRLSFNFSLNYGLPFDDVIIFVGILLMKKNTNRTDKTTQGLNIKI